MRIFLFVLLLGLVGCHREEISKHNYNLVGKWKRIESYTNPGDGGSWQKDQTNPPLTIEFAADGKLVSNSGLYSGFTGYKILDNTIEFSPAMNGVTRAVYYSFNSDTELTLTYACIEGCGDKFVKY